MQDGDIVVMDVAGEYSMYATDITRTAPVNGKFTARQREIYNIVLASQEAAMQAFQAGKSKLATSRTDSDSLYKVAFDYINTHGKDLHGEPLGKYFIHGLGHHVGLNVHDANDPALPLDKGMIFTLERAFTFPKKNWACVLKICSPLARMANSSCLAMTCHAHRTKWKKPWRSKNISSSRAP